MLILTMPARGIAEQRFELQRFDAIAPERGGRIGGITLGEPLWQAEYRLSRAATRAAEDEWSAFFGRLRGSQRPFIGYDRLRVLPREHAGGFAAMVDPSGNPFTGAAASWSQTINADGEARLTLTGLPKGLRLRPRDYVGFVWDGEGSTEGAQDRRTKVRIEGSGDADSSGEIEVTIEPAVSAAVPAGAVAHLDRPSCLMRAVPGSIDFGMSDTSLDRTGGGFSAIQDLRP